VFGTGFVGGAERVGRVRRSEVEWVRWRGRSRWHGAGHGAVCMVLISASSATVFQGLHSDMAQSTQLRTNHKLKGI